MVWLLLLLLPAEGPPSPAEAAYAAMRAGQYSQAAGHFREASRLEPGSASLRKDYAYALLKTGDREAARDQMGAALELDPTDEPRSLEYAFLCYETGRPVIARRTFQRLRFSSNPTTRSSADKAFDSIDRPLAEGIARWQEALRRAPGQWSAHEELARLAEQREELPLAAEHYEKAWQLRPAKSELLLDLARIWRAAGQDDQARLALVTAFRVGSPRIAESAREALGGSVPSAGEPALPVPAAPATERQTANVLSAKEMGDRSLEQNFIDDARQYFLAALYKEPNDGEVLYKLGLIANLQHKDRDALRYFDRARKANSTMAAEASTAYDRLRPTARAFRMTAWAIPIYLSRYHDTFFYGQVRAEWKIGRLHPYLSLRFVGDSRGHQVGPKTVLPAYLSESNVIAGGGLRLNIRSNLFAWAEAGESVSYLGRRRDTGLAKPDYRAGVSFLKGFGRLLGSNEPGFFAETGLDGVYVSRFSNDLFLYSQTHAGYTLFHSTGGFQAQLMTTSNLTLDRNGHPWANTFELGPGVRLRLPGMPAGLSFRAELLRGRYLFQNIYSRRPDYWDTRIGMWYAFAP
jgi:Flp pilus assembly protein TadD